MALGGLYDVWNQDGQGPRLSCSIITMDPNKLISPIDDRMPFILRDDAVKTWLDSSLDDPEFLLEELIVPYPAEPLESRQVWPPENPQLSFF